MFPTVQKKILDAFDRSQVFLTIAHCTIANLIRRKKNNNTSCERVQKLLSERVSRVFTDAKIVITPLPQRSTTSRNATFETKVFIDLRHLERDNRAGAKKKKKWRKEKRRRREKRGRTEEKGNSYLRL